MDEMKWPKPKKSQKSEPEIETIKPKSEIEAKPETELEPKTEKDWVDGTDSLALEILFDHVDQVDWYGTDAVMMLETVSAKDCCGLIMDAGYELKNWYFEDAGVIVKTFESGFAVEESISFISKSRLPFSFQFESNIVSNSFINKFELSFDYPSVPEVLCMIPNDFDDCGGRNSSRT